MKTLKKIGLTVTVLACTGCSWFEGRAFNTASVYSSSNEAPYYRGHPGGNDLKIQVYSYDYSVFGSRGTGGTTR